MLKKIQSKIEPHLPKQYKEIATHFSYVFALRFFQQLISFVSFFFIVNYVPKEIIGHYHFVLSVIALTSITSMPGMKLALTQAIARGHGGFIKIATRYILGGSFIGSLFLFCVAIFSFFYHHDPVLAVSFIISACLYPCAKGLLLWKDSYVGAERFKMLSILDLIGTLVTSALLMISALYHTKTPVLLLTISLLIPAIQNLWLSRVEYKKYKNEEEDPENLKDYGIKVTLYKIMPIIALEIDKLSIYMFLSAPDLAIYNIAMKIPQAVKAVIQDLGGVIMPKFARIPHYSDKLNKSLWYFSAVSFFGIMFFTLFIFPDLFTWLVTDEYKSSVLYGQIFLTTIAINSHSVIRVNYIMSQNNAESFKAVTFLSTIVKIITAPVLIFFLHLWGAILAIVLQRLINLIGVEIIMRKYHRQTKTEPSAI